ncbi:MAG TPA: urease accessory protein UreD [Acidimicrobiales bacterium]|nr:urease accessory protein UreD [Acidimicrobiales bacterium]
MIARGRVVMEVDGGGRSRLACLRSEGPLVLRPAAGTLVRLVSGAGGPLGGDVLTIEVVVGPGAELTLRTVGAAIALPGPGPGPSVVEVDVRVGEGGALRWLPEPTVAADGCDHRARSRVVLAADARLVWREELIRGRYGEDGGSVSSRLSVDYDGRPLVRHQVEMGPDGAGFAWGSPAVAAGARGVGSLLVVEPAWADAGPPGPVTLEAGAAARLPLAGPAVHVLALAHEAIALRRLLVAGEATLTRRQPSSGRSVDSARVFT